MKKTHIYLLLRMAVVVLLLTSCGLIRGENRFLYRSDVLQVSNTIDFTQLEALSNKKIEWGIGKTKSSNGQPRDCVEANQKWGKYNAVFAGQPTKQVYLTFDNGYENGNTIPILNTLKEKRVPAVFFLTGDYVKENKDLVDRMIQEGHIIGNHGYLHKSFPSLSIRGLTEEIGKLDELMKSQHNYEMTLVRPPKGEFSERVLEQTRQLGYQTVLWSFAYLDYQVNNQPDAKKSLERTLTGLHPGAIYLLHSLSNTNVVILPDLIDQIRAQGYSIGLYKEIPVSCSNQNQVSNQCR